MLNERLLNRKQVAELFGKCPHTIARWEKQGLRVIRVNRSVLYDSADVEAFIAERKSARERRF